MTTYTRMNKASLIELIQSLEAQVVEATKSAQRHLPLTATLADTDEDNDRIRALEHEIEGFDISIAAALAENVSLKKHVAKLQGEIAILKTERMAANATSEEPKASEEPATEANASNKKAHCAFVAGPLAGALAKHYGMAVAFRNSRWMAHDKDAGKWRPIKESFVEYMASTLS